MALDQVTSSNALAADARTLNALKLQAGQQTPAAIKETAKQLESLFMRELIKSMRDATMKSGLMDGPQGDLGRDLMDQQFAVQMSGMPGGLSELITKQLAQQAGLDPATLGQADHSTVGRVGKSIGAPTPASAAPAAAPAKNTSLQAGFVNKLNDVAQRVARDSGIPASFMIGQAGHETGWGKHEIRMKDGTPSFNLFGIKAGPNWKGPVAEVTTTEYINGEPKKTVARFRAYESYEASMRDYSRMISTSPRYAQARQQTGSAHAYAASLQKAGYATDPNYALKLSQAINTTLRVQRAQA